MRSEVADNTGNVKYIRKSVFRYQKANVCLGGGRGLRTLATLLHRQCNITPESYHGVPWHAKAVWNMN